MRFAIRLACLNRQAAEPEILGCGVADGPFAGLLSQFHQRQFLRLLLDLIDLGQCLGADFVGRGLRRQRLACRDDLTAGGDGGFRLGRGRRAGRFGFGCGFGLGLGLGRGGRFFLGFGLGRGRPGGAVRQAQTVHLANDRVAGHAAQFLGDLAGRLAFAPHLLQQFYALVSPGHLVPFKKRESGPGFGPPWEFVSAPYSNHCGPSYKRSSNQIKSGTCR